MTYAVTGSTGAFGALALQHLRDQGVAAKDLIALARDLPKASGRVPAGVEVRHADYDRPETLAAALRGIDRLLLVSGSEVGKRAPQHQAVIEAAVQAGVSLIVYTSITRADTSTNPLAPEHKATEAALRKAGIPFVVVRNNWYHENYVDDVKLAAKTGQIRNAAGSGKVASATRSEYAEAAARALTGSAPSGTVYELCGQPWTFSDLAKAIQDRSKKSVTYHQVSPDQRKADLLAAGLPEGVAGFVTALDLTIAEGTLDANFHDLETLLGRRPVSIAQWVAAMDL